MTLISNKNSKYSSAPASYYSKSNGKILIINALFPSVLGLCQFFKFFIKFRFV